MHLLPRLRTLPRRQPWLVLLCVLALLLAQAGWSMAAVPADLAPSMASICSASNVAGHDSGGAMGHAGGHGDCCLGHHGPAQAPMAGTAAWLAPAPVLRLLPVLWLSAPRPLAVWAPWQSRAPPQG